jgi:hypothetical protein
MRSHKFVRFGRIQICSTVKGRGRDVEIVVIVVYDSTLVLVALEILQRNVVHAQFGKP